MSALRDDKGRFLPGHKQPGPGRSPRKVETEYARLLADVVTPDEWLKVCKTALRDAKKGNSTARQWISDYLIGKPKQVLTLEAGETILLAQVLSLWEKIGLQPQEVLQAMLIEGDNMIIGHISDGEGE